MADTKATPRPWRYVRNPFGNLLEIRAGDISIADLRWNGENAKRGEANAALIVDAANSYDRLRRVEKLAGELLRHVKFCTLPDEWPGRRLAQQLEKELGGE